MITTFLDRLQRSPYFATALREMEDGELASRSELIRQMREATAGMSTERMKQSAAQERSLRDELTDLERRKVEINAQISDLMVKRSREIFACEADAKRLAKQIRSTANPKIFRFITWAHRAKNLASFASHYSAPQAYEGEAAAAREPMSVAAARRVSMVVAECVARAEEMIVESQREEEIVRELSAMAAAIFSAYSAVPSARSFSQDFEGQLF